jgi:hypothetical protein
MMSGTGAVMLAVRACSLGLMSLFWQRFDELSVFGTWKEELLHLDYGFA